MEEKKLNNKAIGLLSGGLDSTLAVKFMLELGIEVTVLNFTSPFCTCTSANSGCKSEAVRVANEFGVDIKMVAFGQEYLDMIKNPAHGYGKNMNPCLDCRILMFGKSKEIMKELGASFIFTGEVMGQRPMSQRKDAMSIVERESGLKGLILRPLSAKLLPPTEPELHGIVDREKLLAISGRSRKPQMNMAKEYGVDYPCPSGGCLLTDKGFATRLRDLIKFSDDLDMRDVRFLRIGRHFRISEECKAIVGRNEEENNRLENMADPENYVFYGKDVKGPITIVRGNIEDNGELISQITAWYTDADKGSETVICYKKNLPDQGEAFFTVKAVEEARLKQLIIQV